MLNSKTICILSILIILSLTTISAQTLVAGKIYNSAYSHTIPDVDLLITCNSSSLSTKSLDDGTYAVRFEETECAKDDLVTVAGDKFGFIQKTESGIINKCETGNCGGSYFAIINFALELKTSSGGNNGGSSFGSSRYYHCGNGFCDTGETINTCPEDCKTKEVTGLTQINLDNGGNLGLTEETEEGFFSTITGAVIGTISNYKFSFGFLLIILILAITFTVYKKKK